MIFTINSVDDEAQRINLENGLPSTMRPKTKTRQAAKTRVVDLDYHTKTGSKISRQTITCSTCDNQICPYQIERHYATTNAPTYTQSNC